jgi:hypothetical protein
MEQNTINTIRLTSIPPNFLIIFLILIAIPLSKGLVSYVTPNSTHSALAARSRTTPNDAPHTHTKDVHFVILSHGFVGSSRDLTYLRDAICKAGTSAGSSIITFCPTCNEGRTTDGVRKGGERLATSITRFLTSELSEMGDVGEVKLTLIGNSLGGLYARYAASLLFGGDGQLVVGDRKIVPNMFVTTASPWLGISKQTFIPIPRFLEMTIGATLGETGRDLFRMNSLVYEMGTMERYLDPLRSFKRRVAMSNSRQTDFLVPHGTALWLHKGNGTPHVREDVPEGTSNLIKGKYRVGGEGGGGEKAGGEKEHLKPGTVEEENAIASVKLDELGWEKIVVDVTSTLPSFRRFFRGKKRRESRLAERTTLTSFEMDELLGEKTERWTVPNGHNMIVANAKSKLYEKLYDKGKPCMDFLAVIIVDE